MGTQIGICAWMTLMDVRNALRREGACHEEEAWVCLSVCLSVCLLYFWSKVPRRSLSRGGNMSVSVCLPVCVCLSVSVCLCLSVCVCLSVSVCLRLSVCYIFGVRCREGGCHGGEAWVCLSVCLSVCLCLSVCYIFGVFGAATAPVTRSKHGSVCLSVCVIHDYVCMHFVSVFVMIYLRSV